MPPLNLPSYPIKIVEKNGKRSVFDIIRRKYVTLTPEEWVRQHFTRYLMAEKGFPKELMANEVFLTLNGTAKRCDTVVYNRFLEPVIIIEYKAPQISITQAVFDQITRYNMVMHVDYLIISNGINHYCCKIDYEKQDYAFLEEIPGYGNLCRLQD